MEYSQIAHVVLHLLDAEDVVADVNVDAHAPFGID